VIITAAYIIISCWPIKTLLAWFQSLSKRAMIGSL